MSIPSLFSTQPDRRAGTFRTKPSDTPRRRTIFSENAEISFNNRPASPRDEFQLFVQSKVGGTSFCYLRWS
jgi:hypothetical protein